MTATKKIGGHETTLVLTPKTVLEELSKARRDTKKRVQSMNGTLGEKIGKAVEEKHLDRKAFGLACQLDALDDERLHVTYFNLLYYMEQMGIEKRATAQEELFVNGGADDEDGEDDAPANGKANGKGRAKKDNVTPIGKAARAVTEAAGDEFKSTH